MRTLILVLLGAAGFSNAAAQTCRAVPSAAGELSVGGHYAKSEDASSMGANGRVYFRFASLGAEWSAHDDSGWIVRGATREGNDIYILGAERKNNVTGDLVLFVPSAPFACISVGFGITSDDLFKYYLDQFGRCCIDQVGAGDGRTLEIPIGAEAGHVFTAGPVRFGPSAGVTYWHLDAQYSEAGGAWSSHAWSGHLAAGVRFERLVGTFRVSESLTEEELEPVFGFGIQAHFNAFGGPR